MDNEDTAQDVAPELNLELSNEKLAQFIEAYEKKYEEFIDEKKIKERRKENRKYLFGKQLRERKDLSKHYRKYVDNIIKEAEDILRPLVLSRVPDIVVNPGADSQVSRQTAEVISEAINKTLQSDELKKILTKAFRRHPMDFVGVIKYYWDSQKGKLGDIEWQVIPADNIRFDISATLNDQKEMRMIIHDVEKTLNEWIILFPKKEKELKEFAKGKDWKESQDENGIATSIKISEIWFDWKEKAKDFDPEDPEFESYSGVLWKAGKGAESILDKRLNPNWDWEGEEELFIEGQPIPAEVIPQIASLGMDIPGIERKRVYRNYFGKPRKPFIFMGYEQYGEMPFDEISRIEENRYLQDNYDTRLMQINKMLDESRGTHVFSGMSGLQKDTVEELDLNDPEQDIFVEGSLNDVYRFIPKEQPSEAMFADLTRTENRMRAKLHVSGAVGGEITTDVATTTQIQRESSFTYADDISDLTINDVATKMAEALLHMMKLRYTEQHFRALIGNEGEMAQMRLTQDLIEDGMEVAVKTSGTDKLRRERQAKEEAELGLIDPVNYLKDTGRDDPENRAEMAFLWNNAPELYFKKYIQKQDLPDIANQISQMNQANLQTAGGGAPGSPPMQPSPADTTNISPVPQGSPRNLVGKAGQALSKLFTR
jgi:hypothetical protein